MAVPFLVIGGIAARFAAAAIARAAARAAIREGIKRLPQAPIPKAPPPAPVTGTKPKPAQTTPAPAPVTPPAPLPTPQPSKGNTRPVGHNGKEDDKKTDCKKELEKYPVHPHGGRDEDANKINDEQSHHVVQHAIFMDGKQKLSSSLEPPICTAYSFSAAPCIALRGGTKDPTSPHGKATLMQREHANEAEASGRPYTYGKAKENAEKQLEAGELTSKEAKCVMAVVDEWIKRLCPKINDNTIVRIPWSKNNT